MIRTVAEYPHNWCWPVPVSKRTEGRGRKRTEEEEVEGRRGLEDAPKWDSWHTSTPEAIVSFTASAAAAAAAEEEEESFFPFPPFFFPLLRFVRKDRS